MKLTKKLFSKRRWMLWLPVPAAALLAGPGFQFVDCVRLLIGGLVFWIPFWLAWWLSDGFRTIRLGGPGWRPSMGDSNDSAPIYMNYAEGRFQGYEGPSTYRL